MRPQVIRIPDKSESQRIRIPNNQDPKRLTLPLVWQSYDQQKTRQKSFGDVKLSNRSPKPEEEEEEEATERNSQGHWISHDFMVGMTSRRKPEVSHTQRHMEH